MYFELNAALLDFVREEDLQAVYDVVVKKSFDPGNFNFTRRDNKLLGEFIEKETNPKSNMSREERWAMAQEIDRKAKPCVYGVLCFFRMKCNEKTPVIDSVVDKVCCFTRVAKATGQIAERIIIGRDTLGMLACPIDTDTVLRGKVSQRIERKGISVT